MFGVLCERAERDLSESSDDVLGGECASVIGNCCNEETGSVERVRLSKYGGDIRSRAFGGRVIGSVSASCRLSSEADVGEPVGELDLSGDHEPSQRRIGFESDMAARSMSSEIKMLPSTLPSQPALVDSEFGSFETI